MDDVSDLDKAHARMQAGNDAARLQFYELLADTNLFVPLEHDASGDNISPEVFETQEGRFLLGFDSEDRLTRFTGKVTPYAGLTGRVLLQMLAGQGIGLGLNLEVAPSSILIPTEAVAWLNQALSHMPDHVSARILSCSCPMGLPDGLLDTLAMKLTNAGGLASAAYLVGVAYEGDGQGHLLGFVGAETRAEAALAKAAGEALTFSGVEAGSMDVGFFKDEDPVTQQLKQFGFCLELAGAAPVEQEPPTAPGRDKSKPPILR